jgi:hypothetical protein
LVPGIKFLKLLLLASTASAAPARLAPTWSQALKPGAPAALAVSASPASVIVLAHGMNMRPERMEPLAAELAARGAAVAPLVLAGHRGETDRFKGVSLERWRADADAAFDGAAELSAKEGVPLQFVGYSVGASLGLESISRRGTPVERSALLAPAFALRPTREWALRLAARGSWRVPSRGYEDFAGYRVHDAVSAHAYRALLGANRSLEARNWAGLAVPTLVFADPLDEALSWHRLAMLAGRRFPNMWLMEPTGVAGSRLPKPSHHLITDPDALGTDEWARLTARLATHLRLKSR